MATSSDLRITRWGALFEGRRFPCAIGRGGIDTKRGEGDGITPKGCYKINRIFMRPDRVWIANAHPTGLTDIWSDDPKDPAYNSLKTGPDYRFSYEKLRRADPLYDLVAELDYNRSPVVAGAGSAIFLHVWRRPRYPTEGCVALAPDHLAYILSRWSDHRRVVIR